MFESLFANCKKGDGVYLAVLIPTQLITSEFKKPGDIDILIIPHANGVPNYINSVAIEAKVCRPTLSKPRKSPDSLGVSQTNGLLDIGFKNVGALHFVTAEKSPEKDWQGYRVARIDDSDIATDVGLTKLDHFPLKYCDLHYQRIRNYPFSDSVSIGILAPIFDDSTKTEISGFTIPQCIQASSNPEFKDLSSQLKKLLESREVAFLNIPWFS